MFSPRAKQCPLAASASLLPNNLDSIQADDGTVYLSYISNAAIWVTSCKQGTEDEHRNFCTFKSHASVNQVKFFRLDDRIIIAVAGVKEVRLLKLSGEVVMTYKISRFENQDENEPAQFRGIAQADRDQLVIGDSIGRIHVINTRTMTPDTILPAHGASVQYLSAHPTARKDRRLASADVNGRIIIWDASGLKQLREIDAEDEVCCTSMVILDDYLVASYYDGRVSVFSITSGKRLADICAHGRAAYGLAVDTERRLVASVGLDSKAFVWYLPRKLCEGASQQRIQTVFTATIKDRMLPGVTFANDWFRVSCFDSYKMVQFARTEPGATE